MNIERFHFCYKSNVESQIFETYFQVSDLCN